MLVHLHKGTLDSLTFCSGQISVEVSLAPKTGPQAEA